MFELGDTVAHQLSRYAPAGLRVSDRAEAMSLVVSEFKKRLLDGRLNPGQKILFDEMAKALTVSRTPIREAMRRLEAEGLVTSMPNRGFVVKRRDALEMDHLYQARLGVEPYIASEAHSRREAAFIADLQRLHALYSSILIETPSRRRLGMIADKAFHLRIAEQVANPYLIELGHTLFDHYIFTRPIEGFPISRAHEAVREHEAILGAMKGDDPDAVVAAVTDNIENGRTSIAKFLKERDSDSIPL
jgi:DNA-binding GntR family transcriptional regulator